jgi:hypothetical protein
MFICRHHKHIYRPSQFLSMLLPFFSGFAASSFPFQVGIGGVSWSKAPFAAKSLPGLHICPERRPAIQWGYRESQLLLPFPSAESTIFPCPMWLDDSQIEKWRSLLGKPAPVYYHFFIDNISERVPISNGSHFYSHFDILVDPESSAESPKFEIRPGLPIAIVHQDNPTLHPGFFVNLSFGVALGSAPEVRVSTVKPTSVSVLLCTIVLFAPAVWVFWVNRGKFPSLPPMIDVRTLPRFNANLYFFTGAGMTELLRFWIMALLPGSPSVSVFLNIAMLSAIPASLFRAWGARRTGQYVADVEISAFADLGLSFAMVGLVGATIVSRFLFDAFRGPSYLASAVLYFGNIGGLMMSAQAPGLAVMAALPPRTHFFVQDRSKKWVWPSYFHLIVYGLVTAALYHPLVVHAIDWVFDDAQIDFAWIATWLTVSSAFAAFYGMIRTVGRLNTGKGLWQDDHMLFHALPLILVAVDATARAFLVKGLFWLDINGLAWCGIAGLTLAMSQFTFGTMASFGISFLFVYIAVIRGHVVAADGDNAELNPARP